MIHFWNGTFKHFTDTLGSYCQAFGLADPKLWLKVGKIGDFTTWMGHFDAKFGFIAVECFFFEQDVPDNFSYTEHRDNSGKKSPDRDHPLKNHTNICSFHCFPPRSKSKTATGATCYVGYSHCLFCYISLKFSNDRLVKLAEPLLKVTFIGVLLSSEYTNASFH